LTGGIREDGMRPLLRCAFWLALLTLPQPAAAEFPDHAVKFVVGFPPGGTPDTFLRHYTTRLSTMIGQPVLVENKPGAGAMLAAQTVATAKPDGYTILFGPDSTTVGNIFLFKQLPYDPDKDLVLVAPMIWNTFVLLINPQTTAAASVADLTALLKSKGGRAHYGSPNSVAQMMAETYKAATGAGADGVNFRGALDGVNALVAGEIDFTFSDVGSALSFVRAGKVKALAVSSKRRPAVLPDVPSMVDLGFPGFDVDGTLGAYLPSATPADMRDKINGWLNKLNADPDIRTALAVVGAESFPPMTAADNDTLLREKRAVWADMVAKAKIEPQ
jgi:tripartite-type tricarboxylate transporter receptor subunit TctC